MILQSIRFNEVNRVKQVILSAAGKAVNTARALAVLGADCRVAGFNGGHNVEQINGFLAEYGITSALTAMSAATRICTTLIDETTGAVTELVEEAPRPSDAEIQRFIQENTALLKECKLLAICGTLPPWADDNFYRSFTTIAAELDVPVVIDSHKGALLEVLQDRPAMAKLNLSELETTFKERVKSESQLFELMGRLIAGGAKSVLLTQGKDPAYLLEGENVSKHVPPQIIHHRNPIGSGDCTTAGIACALTSGSSLPEAVKLGLACGSANVETLLPADITRERVLQMRG